MSRAMILSLAGIILSGTGGLVNNIFTAKLPKMAGILTLYLGAAVMLLNVCSFQMCAALFACGIGVTVLLGTGIAGLSADRPDEKKYPVLLFRFILSLILGILAFTITERIRSWIPVRWTVLFICLWIILMDLISISIDDILLFRCFNLQGICLAFTVCYIYMENSVLVFGCFAVINLLMAFGSAVLTGRQQPEPEYRDGETA